MVRMLVSALLLGGVAATSASVHAQSNGRSIMASDNAGKWIVIVDPDKMRFSRLTKPYPSFYLLPPPTMTRQGGKPIYRSQLADGTALTMQLDRVPCPIADGDPLPFRASVTVGGETLTGCASEDDFYPGDTPVALGDLDMGSRILGIGGPRGFAFDIDSNQIAAIKMGGKSYELGKPYGWPEDKPWPMVENGVATFALMNLEETVSATARITKESCRIGAKTYPLKLEVQFQGASYASCATQAYQELKIAPPVVMMAPGE